MTYFLINVRPYLEIKPSLKCHCLISSTVNPLFEISLVKMLQDYTRKKCRPQR